MFYFFKRSMLILLNVQSALAAGFTGRMRMRRSLGFQHSIKKMKGKKSEGVSQCNDAGMPIQPCYTVAFLAVRGRPF
jgi:hypothetical protein